MNGVLRCMGTDYQDEPGAGPRLKMASSVQFRPIKRVTMIMGFSAWQLGTEVLQTDTLFLSWLVSLLEIRKKIQEPL